ncbi:protein Aster-B isoform X2 [Drosophila sulfurigaster albostrigata]|uniref:protein Aster-B isoform X2 n=1 Tax=Drosophila sulfurigaster albostrigata TaxID=89887 RepID=UPI002D21DE98|nr:protein Aster-B isoform X2 [Drosophila sulfurigaster albostrigata]
MGKKRFKKEPYVVWIKDIDITTTPTTTTTTASAATTVAAAAATIATATATTCAASSTEPANANATLATNMICDEQQTQQQQQQHSQQQQQQPSQQQSAAQEQLQQQDELDEKSTQIASNGDRRDSITEEITITTTTTNSKLLTIQEAVGIVEHSNISISTSTSLSSIQQTSAVVAATTLTTPATTTAAGTTATAASSVAATEVTATALQRRESVSSNHSNGSHNLATVATNSNGNGSNTVASQPTPSINIIQSESRNDLQQPLQSQSVDSNGSGAAQAGSSCTDSPSSRKSSTSSKGKPAKLSTSSSGRDEDAQSKLSEPGAITESHFVRGETHVSSSSTSNEKPAKGTSRLSERAKKKSWYNVIYPNYKSRAEDFKKLFKEVPNDERLIVDYSCALQRDILVQGRLYVSQNYVCFHANIFTWETYVSIKWKDVTAITKEKTALVIPNAISISTVSKEKFFFATFASRDKSFLMLFRVWQNTLMNKQFSPQEIWRYVHNCYGEELGLTTDDEDYIDPTLDSDDKETDVDFQTAIEDLGGEQSNSNQSINQTSSQPQQQQQQSGNSSASSGGGNATTRKSKTKYFFNSSKSSNLNSSANASASGSDNKASDSTRKSNKKMKANAKELTLSSVKAAEQTVAVTLSVPASSSNSNNTGGNNPSISNSNGTTTTATTTAASTTTTTTSTASGGVASGSVGVTTSDRKSSDKASSHGSAANVSEASHCLESKRKVVKNQRLRDVDCKNDEAGPTDVSDSSDSEENSVPFVPSTECTSTHEGRQIVHAILPIRVDTLFNFLFSKSKFLTDFHEMRKSTDLIMGEWQKNEEGQNVRLVNVTVQLAASVGPKTSKVTEYQTMRECSKPGELYSIDVNSVNAGIPYADSFSVLIHFCLARTVDDHTMLSIHAQIKYKKSIWGVVKGFIEKNTWAGIEDFFCAQLSALQSETCIPPAKGKGRRPRRGTATQIRPSEEANSGNQAQVGKTETLEKWDTKLLSGAAHGQHAAAGGHHLAAGIGVAGGAIGIGGGGGVGGDKQQQQLQQQQLAAQQQQQQLLLAAGGQMQDKFRYKGLSLFVILLMCLLLALNVILLLKLWKLEEHIDVDLSRRARMPSLAALKELPNTNQDWLELLRQQELSHESELRKWHQVLQTAIELLKKTEKTLAEVMIP